MVILYSQINKYKLAYFFVLISRKKKKRSIHIHKKKKDLISNS